MSTEKFKRKTLRKYTLEFTSFSIRLQEQNPAPLSHYNGSTPFRKVW